MNTYRKKIFLLCAVAMALTLYACKVTKPYQAPKANINGLYRGVNTADTNSIAQLSWRQVFTDTVLQRLIDEGIKQNIDLQVAYSRIRQAQATYRQSKMAYFPTLDAYADLNLASQQRRLNNQVATNNRSLQAGLSSSWEADIWGKLKSTERANFASFLATEANARAVKTTLVANIATYYYTLLSLDRQIAVTRESVKNWQSTVDIMQKLKTADVVTGAAVVQSEASKYAVAVTLPDLQQSVWQTENSLNILLGRVPDAITRDSLNDVTASTNISTGVPAQLLSGRPDVQAAEFQFRNAFELTNVARTYFYPAVTISASGGYTSLNTFFSPGSLIGNFTAGLTQPIFNQGINKARLASAKEAQHQAALNYQYTLLNAGMEVSNALHNYQSAAEKFGMRKQQLINLQKAVSYTQQLVRYGSANYTEVLTAQQSLLAAQLNQINDKVQQLQAVVALYSALGGGWK